MDFKTLAIRSASGLVYVALLVGAILAGGIWMVLLALVFGVIALWELENITLTNKKESLDYLSFGMDILGLVTVIFMWYYDVPMILWVLVVIARLLQQLYSSYPQPFKAMAISLTGQLYIAFPLAIFCLMSLLTPSLQLLAIVGMIWINDTGAFLTGSLIGKHRLFPKHSPKKSWEGFAGGLIFNLIAGFIFGSVCFDNFSELPYSSVVLWMIAGGLVTIFATWGDLIESMIKRSVGVKDSGNIIPGHGGILDRIDSLLIVIPMIYIYIYLLYNV